MTEIKDASETLDSLEKITRLQKEIQHLQQENKVLHIRAQGVQVLGVYYTFGGSKNSLGLSCHAWQQLTNAKRERNTN